VRCRHVPLHCSQLLGTLLRQEPAQVHLHQGLMQVLCLGIARHMGYVHVRFWLLSNCIIGLSQKDTPSV